MNRVTLPPTAFLGAGSMARAIIAGLQASDVAVVGGIRTTNRSAERAAELASSRVTAYATETDAEANRRAVRGAGLVIIAVKPAMVPDLLLEIADALDPHAVVVSVAAGVTTARCEELLPGSGAGEPVPRTWPWPSRCSRQWVRCSWSRKGKSTPCPRSPDRARPTFSISSNR